jgi:hypothetical protein
MSNDHPKPVSAPHAVGVELSDEQIDTFVEEALGLAPQLREALTYEKWHDGIEVDYVTPDARAFARAILASSAQEAALRFVGAAGPLGDPDVMAAQKEPQNQCDGCMQGAELRGGMHIDRSGHAFMSCQRDKYEAKESGNG